MNNIESNNLSAQVLGQLMLMQSVMGSLPDQETIYSFVCRGLLDVPGVADVRIQEHAGKGADADVIRLPIPLFDCGEHELLLKVIDRAAFHPYKDYLQNFCYMVGVILDERDQRHQNTQHRLELELRVDERTKALCQEVQERRLAEELLRKSEERLKFVLEGSRLGFWDWDVEANTVDISPLWAEMLGYSYDEIGSSMSHWTEFIHPNDRALAQASINAHLEGQTVIHVCEYRMRTRDENYIWVLDRAMIVKRGEDGRPLRMSGTHADITDRKNAEETRDKALAFSETLLASSPTGIQVFEGITGECEMANQSLADSVGGPVGALRSMNFRRIAAWSDAGYDKIAEEVLADGITRRAERAFTTSFGRAVVFDSHLSRFEVNGRAYLMFVATDITQKKLQEEKNRCLEEQMLHVQKLESLGVLAGGIAHDFNNILMAVIGNADLALMRLGPESPARDNLHNIEQAARRAADLASQMLAYSGKGRFVIESLNLTAVVEEMTHMLAISISKKAVMRFNFTTHLPSVEADATQIRQVLMNLVINASEAIGDRSGVIAINTGAMDCDSAYLSETWIDDRLPEGLYVYVEVSDTGCGIEKEHIKKIFDPFFTTKFTGRGLGMAAVLGIVRGHKGAIKVYSEPGKGTIFKLLLPASHRVADEHVLSHLAEHAWSGAGTLLLVDDEETLRALGKDMLQQLGFTVLTAADGREALDIYRQNKETICCVILDLTMPHLDGEQTFRELRRINPGVRVLMSSGYNEQEVTQKFVGKGLAGFLQKPYNLTQIGCKLREILEEQRNH
jgi:two-component system, cell cycle sensor histidine kinase and response regulator CckA